MKFATASASSSLVVLILFAFVSSVISAGLNEEFTWSRINYRWPKNGQNLKRQTNRGRYRHYNNNNNNNNNGGGTIVFEGNTNGESEENREPSGGNDGGSVGNIDYRYETNIPMGANVWKNKLFITVPRRRLGVPSTLNYVPIDNPIRHNVPLIPYPNWRTNLYPDPTNSGQNLVSVYRIAIDPCDRMWFVDTGIIETLGNATMVKPTTIMAIDLNTDQIIHKYEIPQSNLRPNSGLASITIDVTKDTCDDAFAYIPDLSGYGLIVYSLKQNKSWRVSHNYFFLEPHKGEFFIAGHRFQWNDGIFSVELSQPKSDGFRDLYFHSMAGTHMYRVSTRIVRNETLATRSYHENDFENLGDRGEKSQTSKAEIHEPSGTMFLNLVNQNAVGCWNIQKALDTISIVQKDDKKMIYPSDIKVRDDKVYVLTNTMPEFLYGRLNYDEINFRVWSNTVEDAIRGTKCHNNKRGRY